MYKKNGVVLAWFGCMLSAENVIAAGIQAATLIPTTGIWQGKSEAGTLVIVYCANDHVLATLAKLLFLLRETEEECVLLHVHGKQSYISLLNRSGHQEELK